MIYDVLEVALNIYNQNPSVFFVIMSSAIILIFSLLMSNGLKRRETRIVMIVVPIAVLTYLLSLNLEGATEHDFFQNLSTEFIGGLLALILFAEWITTNQYSFPIIAVLIFGIAGVFMWQATVTADGFYINLSTELLGALVTTAVVRRDWLWSQGDLLDDGKSERRARFATKRETLERETAKRLCDMHVTLFGTTLQDLEKRQHILSESADIVYLGKVQQRNGGGLQQLIYCNARDITTYEISHEHVTVVFDGNEQAIQHVSQRFSETFEIQESEEVATQVSHNRSQMRLKVKTPEQSFQQELHDMIDMFVTRWQQSLHNMPPPSEAYVNGYHEAIEFVCHDLSTTIKSA